MFQFIPKNVRACFAIFQEVDWNTLVLVGWFELEGTETFNFV